MKRIPRAPERFEVLELFTSLGTHHGFTVPDKGSHDEFVRRIAQSLDASSKNPALLHGQRVQAMFGYVVASLGRAVLIKEEDSGEIYVSDPEIRVPDFHVVLEDGSGFLVEVKNCHNDPHEPFTCKGSYLVALSKYASIVSRPLRLAVYWSRANIWTLISAQHLPRMNGDVVLEFSKALKMNEMAELGDLQVATTPPLVLRVITDPAKPRRFDETGHVKFTIGGIEFYCHGRRIEKEEERNLAFYFMLYGNWESQEPDAHVDNGELNSIDFPVAHPAPSPPQGFEIIGSISGMISRRFNDLTAPEGSIERIVPSREPGSLGVVIPRDYKGEQLPLWRFIQQPNYE